MRGHVLKLCEDFGFISAANKKLFYFRFSDVIGPRIQIGSNVEFKVYDCQKLFEKSLMDGKEKDNAAIGSFRNPKPPKTYRACGKGQRLDEVFDVQIVEASINAA